VFQQVSLEQHTQVEEQKNIGHNTVFQIPLFQYNILPFFNIAAVQAYHWENK
jgi:hypothetical protein